MPEGEQVSSPSQFHTIMPTWGSGDEGGAVLAVLQSQSSQPSHFSVLDWARNVGRTVALLRICLPRRSMRKLGLMGTDQPARLTGLSCRDEGCYSGLALYPTGQSYPRYTALT